MTPNDFFYMHLLWFVYSALKSDMVTLQFVAHLPSIHKQQYCYHCQYWCGLTDPPPPFFLYAVCTYPDQIIPPLLHGHFLPGPHAPVPPSLHCHVAVVCVPGFTFTWSFRSLPVLCGTVSLHWTVTRSIFTRRGGIKWPGC